jgi:hypothetical protein
MLVTVFTPKYELKPGTGIRIWRECERDSLFIFWRNIDSIQYSGTDLVIRQTGMVYQLVFADEAKAEAAYQDVISSM